ncbi:MAG: aldehyde dehydrogenase [Pseudomonadota bacterium]
MPTIKSFYCAGSWIQGSGLPITSFSPIDGRELTQLGSASESDLSRAVAAAQQALDDPAWRELKRHMRARLLHKMGAMIDAEADSLALIQMHDNGKTLRECRAQMASAANTFRYYASACETFEEHVTPSRGDYWSMALYEPVGVVAAITPWNSPATLEAQKLAPILAAGNAVILKPSELTPLIALEYARLAERVGFPRGIVSVLTGTAELGRAIVAHPDIDMISFTGGSEAGKSIASEAGKRLKPVVLELGGKSPHIVFNDADFERAVISVADGIFSGAGQSCVAGSRIFLQRPLYERFVKALVEHAGKLVLGDPSCENTDIGPLVSFAHRDAVHAHVTRAISDGAEVLLGGGFPEDPALAKGAYYPPTLLAGLENSSELCQQEIFGPVAALLPFDDESDLLAQANHSDFGLASGIWTQNQKRAWRIARALNAGTVWINTYKQLAISTPFGGRGYSGIGAEKGLQGMRAYMQPKGIFWAE